MPPRMIAVVGATATGKTALAVALARALGGEIINADSRQVYRGMDIGTAKPTAGEQAAARHWLVDVAGPGETYTLARFLDDAHAALADISRRGAQPIVAGGTAQYVWALLEGWRVPRVPPDPALRRELEAQAEREGAESVARVLQSIDPESARAIDPRNVRRVIRAVEVTRATGRPFSAWQQRRAPEPPPLIIGLRMDRDALYAGIDARVDAMMHDGLVAEVESLLAAGHACTLPSMSGIGYRQVCEHLAGRLTLADAVGNIKTETHRLARMQHTWFRAKDPRIRWFDAASPSLAEDALASIRAAGLPDAGSRALS